MLISIFKNNNKMVPRMIVICPKRIVKKNKKEFIGKEETLKWE